MKREMVSAIVSMGEYNRFSKGIFGWIGYKTYWLSYKNVERAGGKQNGIFGNYLNMRLMELLIFRKFLLVLHHGVE